MQSFAVFKAYELTFCKLVQSGTLESARIQHTVVCSNIVGASEAVLSIAVLNSPDDALGAPLKVTRAEILKFWSLALW